MDIDELENRYFLTLHGLDPMHMLLTISATDLLHENQMNRLLDMYGPLIKSDERSVTAAFFCNWYASVCSALQNMLFGDEDYIYDLSLSNISVQLYIQEQYPLFSFKIKNTKRIQIPKHNREEWCTQVLQVFYKENVRPLLEVLSGTTQINALSLWGQVVSTLYSHMEEELSETSDENNKRSITFQKHILRHGLDASILGLLKNPFEIKLRFTQHINDSGRQVLIKPSCCQAYRLDAKFGYCYVCPRLKEVDRVSMRAGSCG
ncbi:hypothetical protein OM416_03770 [Paenibacillus sp. LS1]|uniref:hypothetical protein n=1 Tax=Paenibacillus sp. LS1 TaxID=2992120 RepID=UPI002231E23C|nr:hypothetical protein [Paenibacillus sp. LS1]MCW3790684.1 hypothetical protein [Paenibacillus sp. LS1]